MTKEEFLLKGGIDFNMLWVLQHPKLLKENIRVNGWTEVCKKKGLLDNYGELTEKGHEIVNMFEEKIEISNITIQEEKETIYQTIEKELIETLINSGYKANLKGFGNVPFLPDAIELERHLKMFWKDYPQFKDIKKITKILKEHINECSKKNSFAPACKYFIYKRGIGGYLGNIYKNYKEKEEEIVVEREMLKKEDLF